MIMTYAHAMNVAGRFGYREKPRHALKKFGLFLTDDGMRERLHAVGMSSGPPMQYFNAWF